MIPGPAATLDRLGGNVPVYADDGEVWTDAARRTSQA
jgi:hypothetical protein